MGAAGDCFDVDIVALGSRGDGIAETPRGRVFVPLTVVGDRVRLRLDRHGAPLEVTRLSDGPHRAAPACPHFGACGGCTLQHVEDGAYADWKRGLVTDALARRGLEAEVLPVQRAAPGARRRARFGVRVARGGVVLGFNRRRSRDLIDVRSCPVMAPEIVAVLPALRDALGACMEPGGAAEVSVTLAEGELDVLIESRGAPDLAGRERLARLADAADLARLSWGDEPVVTRRVPQARVAGRAVDLPPRAFLQPTADGEAALREAVLGGLAGGREVADLFAGCGAFALALAAAGMTVHAVEGDAAQAAALEAAARRGDPPLRVAVETRDLDRRPLAGRELSRFDGLVLDPPRGGAAPQARAIAQSPVASVVYVSCNPATFARDARTLVDGGYRLGRIAPVDQFLWSPHVELAATFRKP